MGAAKRWLHRVVFARRWLTFNVMVTSFLVFGAGTLNLFYVVRANGSLLLDNGWMAVMDGALRQSGELLATTVAALAAYVVFKACEYRLVHWLGDADDAAKTTRTQR